MLASWYFLGFILYGAAAPRSLHHKPARGELFPHSITCTCQFGDDAVDLRLLPFEPGDPFAEFRQRDLELGHLPIAEVIEVEHLAHFLERKADRLAGKHIRKPRAVAAGIEPL